LYEIPSLRFIIKGPLAYGNNRLIALIDGSEFNLAVLVDGKWERIGTNIAHTSSQGLGGAMALAYGNRKFVFSDGQRLYYSNDQ